MEVVCCTVAQLLPHVGGPGHLLKPRACKGVLTRDRAASSPYSMKHMAA